MTQSKGNKPHVIEMRRATHVRAINQFKRRIADGKKKLWHDQETTLRCWECKIVLALGDKAVSKHFGHHWRIYYCKDCAKLLKII